MAIRLVAIDLDGTLLDRNSAISSANRQALADVAARGVEIVVVTGRRYQSAGKILKDFPCPVTLISSNGAMIVSAEGEILHRDFLPRAVARRILQATREFRPYAVAIFEAPGRGQVTMESGAALEGPLGWYQTHSPEMLLQVPDLEQTLTTDPIQLMFGGPPEHVSVIEPYLLERFPAPEFHLTWTKYLGRNLSILDVMNRGCTKGRTLESWAGSRGIPRSDVLAIGDNHNDVEMLRFAGQPVLMGNSSAGLSELGWPVTLTNEQDGVAVTLHKYILSAS